MASTYVNDLRLNEMATGDASGSWGTVTNTNLELIGEAFSYGTETIGDADSTLTIADGAADAARSFYLKITSSVDLTTTRIVTLGPNTVSKVWMIENATTGSQVITIKQGSGATINVPNGQVKMISTDGAGSGGAVLDLLVDVDLTGTTTLVNLDVSGTLGVTGVLTATSLDISGDIDVDGTTNLDAVDIDGATQIDATVTVGVDDTGYDVKFFGATTGKSLLWDESADSLIVTGTTTLVGTTNLDAVDIDGATQIDATVTVGVDDTGYDVKFFGATAGAYMLWDESADDLILGGAAGLSVNSTALVTGVLTTTAATVSNGGGQFNGAINVGVDDTGYDVKFFGATAGKYMLWDESADTLEVSGTVVAAAGTALLPSITTTGDLNTGMWFPAADTIAFSEGGVEALRIDSSGNVGIGTSSPSTQGLHILSSAGVGAISQPYATLNIENSTGDPMMIMSGTSGGIIASMNNSQAATPLRFYTGQTERIRIDASGNVGIGTSSPAAKLEVASPASTTAVLRISSNKTGTGSGDKSRLEFYSADDSGTAYDMGYMVYDRADGTGTASYVAWASRVAGTVAERMRIDSSGAVLVAKTAQNSTAVGVQLNQTGAIIGTVDGGQCLLLNRKSTTGTIIEFQYNNAGVGSVSVTGSATAYNTSSDYRLKTDAQPMVGASDRVLALKPVNFAWIVDGTRVDGFLAHEAQEIVPEAVHGTKDAMRDEEYEVTAAVEATYDEDGNELTAAVPAVMGTRSVPDMQGIDQSKLVPLLTAALQEALTKIADMEIRLSALEG
jgi:hypothetical protein